MSALPVLSHPQGRQFPVEGKLPQFIVRIIRFRHFGIKYYMVLTEAVSQVIHQVVAALMRALGSATMNE